MTCSGAADAKHLAFVSTSRDHKQEWMRIADPRHGDVRDVMGETAAKFFESGNDKVNWHYLSRIERAAVVFSERDNWGHMYLYDAATGKLKNQITQRRLECDAGAGGGREGADDLLPGRGEGGGERSLLSACTTV